MTIPDTKPPINSENGDKNLELVTDVEEEIKIHISAQCTQKQNSRDARQDWRRRFSIRGQQNLSRSSMRS